jgi:PilZ domain
LLGPPLALSLLFLSTAMSRNDSGSSPGNTRFDERRAHQRTPASELKGIEAKLAAGPAIVLVDLSRSGVRFMCDTRMWPKLSIALKFVTPDGEVAVRGHVVRSQLVLDQGRMAYEIAVAFSELLPEFNAAARPAESDPPIADADDTGAGAGAGVPEEDLDVTTILHLTASVPQSVAELRDMFNGNNW